LDLSTFLVVLTGKNKKIGFYFSDKRSIPLQNEMKIALADLTKSMDQIHHLLQKSTN
jgi:hypothetical protein